MRTLLTVILLLAIASAQAEIYRHVDAQGRVTYTDTPPGDAEPVRLDPMNTLPAPQGRAASPAARPPATAAFSGYETLVITGVENDAVLRNPEEAVSVGTLLQPALQPGHVLVIRHNGAVANTEGQPRIVLEEIDRGTHTFQAAVLDAAGNVLIESFPVAVHVHRASALSPLRKPAPAKPAKPGGGK